MAVQRHIFYICFVFVFALSSLFISLKKVIFFYLSLFRSDHLHTHIFCGGRQRHLLVRLRVRSSVRSSVQKSVPSSVRRSVCRSRHSSVFRSVHSSERSSVRSSERSSVRSSVRGTVRTCGRSSMRGSVRRHASPCAAPSPCASVLLR